MRGYESKLLSIVAETAEKLFNCSFNTFCMEQTEYVEWVPAGIFVKTTVAIVIISMLILLALLFVTLQPLTNEDVIGFGVFIRTSLFVLISYMNFRGIKIQIYSRRLSVKYGLFNSKCIRLDEIVTSRRVKGSIGRYGGFGVRYGFDVSYAYTTSFGNAVEISPEEDIPFVFSSNNPDEICELIEKNTAGQQITLHCSNSTQNLGFLGLNSYS